MRWPRAKENSQFDLMSIRARRPIFSDTEKWRVGKADHVKTSAKRQVKARIYFSCILLWLGVSIATVRAAEDVDLLLVNGNVYTVNENQPRAEAVAVRKDRIVFVGSNEQAKTIHGERTINLNGKTILPGLTDSHCHIFAIGQRELTLNLEGTNTLEDFLTKVKERVTKASPGKWITGRG